MMNFRNFFNKIISRFRKPLSDVSSLKKETKILLPLSMDFFFPNLLDYNTEHYFNNGGFGYKKEYLCLKKGVNIKEIEVSQFISFERLKIEKLNLCDICDNPDIGFLVHDADVIIKIKKEKMFRIVIGKISDRPIFYMN